MPEAVRLELEMRRFPATAPPRPAESNRGMVAGARFERVQIRLKPENRFLACRTYLAFAA